MVFNVTSGSVVQAVRAAGSREGGWKSREGSSKEGCMGKIWLGKSGCQWQDVAWGTLSQVREGTGQASLRSVIQNLNGASSNMSGSVFGAKDTR